MSFPLRRLIDGVITVLGQDLVIGALISWWQCSGNCKRMIEYTSPKRTPYGQDEGLDGSQGWRMATTERAILTKVIDRLLPKSISSAKVHPYLVGPTNDISRSFGLLILPLNCV